MRAVTVITPCFNPGRYLRPMLESVEKNSDLIEKHIVMDGGSTDGTVEVLSEWADGHKWFEYFSEKDNGQADACQKALGRIDTEYFYWLNADDIMLENAVKNLTSVLSDAYKPAIVYGDYCRIDGIGKVFARRKQPSFNYWDCLHGYIFVQNAAAIFNTNSLRQLGGFDTLLRFAMDYDIVLKLGKSGIVAHVPHYCGAFRVHNSSKTVTIDDVCQSETQLLRTRYGVTTNKFVRILLDKYVHVRVALRMLREGCAVERVKELLCD